MVASCLSAGAFLRSWSPALGFLVGSSVRGPAATASVQFESATQELTMVVSCSTRGALRDHPGRGPVAGTAVVAAIPVPAVVAAAPGPGGGGGGDG